MKLNTYVWIAHSTDVDELLNLQSRMGKAKPYQIKQFLELVELYNLELGEK